MDINELREFLAEDRYVCFTTDLDWAPECAIEKTIDVFKRNQIRPTVFVTHKSLIIDQNSDAIDIGIHPNFILPSSQGESMDEIIEYCMKLAPDTKVFRAHRWFASNDIYEKLWEKGIRYESNLCSRQEMIAPFVHRSGMISFPVFFEDGEYIIENQTLDFATIKEHFYKKGLKVINIHPMHYALNTPYFSYTREIKDRLTRTEWNSMDEKRLSELLYNGVGIRNFIDDMIEFCMNEDNHVKMITLNQLYNMLDYR